MDVTDGTAKDMGQGFGMARGRRGPVRDCAVFLRENIAGAGLSLSDDDLAELDKIGR